MLILLEPLGSLAFRPSIVVTVVRPRCPEILGKFVPKPSPTASMSSSFDVPGIRRNSEVKSARFISGLIPFVVRLIIDQRHIRARNDSPIWIGYAARDRAGDCLCDHRRTQQDACDEAKQK